MTGMSTLKTFILIFVYEALILGFNSIAASRYQNTPLLKCCQDGMKLNPMRFSCAKRLAKVPGSQECRKAFQDCCEKATALRRQANQRNRVGLARRKDQWHTALPLLPFLWWLGRAKGHFSSMGLGRKCRHQHFRERRNIAAAMQPCIFTPVHWGGGSGMG